ncbi:MAG: hypothetical protein HY307_00360 [Arcobacter sp.]|nr:hypothetical protein [Arcobacter sp.]
MLTSNNISTNQVKSDMMNIVKLYEKLAKLLGIRISTLKFVNNKVSVKISGNLNLIIDFLAIIESTSKIISLDFQVKNDGISADCVVDGKVFDEKLFQSITINSKNPVELTNKISNKIILNSKISSLGHQQKETIDTNDDNKIEHELIDENYIEVFPKSKTTAIIGEYVLVKDEWLRLGDTFDGYKIIEITKKNLKLEKNGRIALKEMFDD